MAFPPLVKCGQGHGRQLKSKAKGQGSLELKQDGVRILEPVSVTDVRENEKSQCLHCTGSPGFKHFV